MNFRTGTSELALAGKLCSVVLQLFSKAAASMETAAMMLMLRRTKSVHPPSFLSLRLSFSVSLPSFLSPSPPPCHAISRLVDAPSPRLSLSIYLSISLSFSHCVCVCVSSLTLSSICVSFYLSLSRRGREGEREGGGEGGGERNS